MKLLVVHDKERVLWAEVFPELTTLQCRAFKEAIARLGFQSSVEEIDGRENFEGWLEGVIAAAEYAAGVKKEQDLFDRRLAYAKEKPGEI